MENKSKEFPKAPCSRLVWGLSALAFIGLSLTSLSVMLYRMCGLERSYLIESSIDGQSSFIMAQTLDRDLSVYSKRLLLAPLFAGWDYRKKSALPEDLLKYHVRWSGFIESDRLISNIKDYKPGLLALRFKDAIEPSKPVWRGAVKDISLKELEMTSRSLNEPFFAEWHGLIRIDNPGVYQFGSKSGDRSWIHLNDKLIVYNGDVGSSRNVSGKIFLRKGNHKLKVRYSNRKGPSELLVFWTPPNKAEEEIPIELMFHEEKLYPSLELATIIPVNLSLNGKREDIFPIVNPMGAKQNVLESVSLFSLKPGLNPFDLNLKDNYSWKDRSWSQIMKIRWQNKEGEWTKIPAHALMPASGNGLGLHYYACVKVAALVWCIFLIVLILHRKVIVNYFCEIKNDEKRSHLFYLGAAWIVSSLGFFLRWWEYDLIPYLADTVDELTTNWIGWNLINTGKPTGWVWGGTYDSTFIRKILGDTLLFAEYAFHPVPLLGLFSAFASSIGGMQEMMQINISHIRIPILLISSLTVPVVICLGRELFGKASGLLGGLVFATLPVIVLIGRLNKEDNLLALLAAVAFLCTLRFVRTGSRKYYFGMLLFVFFSIISKEVGIFAALASIILCARAQLWRTVMINIVVVMLAIACYFAYGLLNWSEFINALTKHANYSNSISGALPLFSTFRISGFYSEGWIVWLWLSAFTAATLDRGKSLIAPISYLLVFSVLAVAIFDAPWYRMPFLPFLCVSAGYVIHNFMKNPDAIKATVFLFTAGVSSVQLVLLGKYGALSDQLPLKAVLFLLAVLACLCEFPLKLNGTRVRKYLSASLVLLFFLGNIFIVFNLDITYQGFLGGMVNYVK